MAALGGGSFGGGSLGGGSLPSGSGGSGGPSTLKDEWANPLVAAALSFSRDGTMDRDNHDSFLNLSTNNGLTQWDPWVRANLCVTELTQRLRYVSGMNTFSLECRDASQQIVQMSPPSLGFFKEQLPFVQSWAELRDERTPEVLAQIDNQLAFIGAVTGLNVARKRWTMEWLRIALELTISVEMMFKHAFGCHRPLEFSPQIQPIITTPGHATYPMGHAAQAFATMVALCGLLNIGSTHPAYRQLYLQARRISVNRVVAGVHFPIDAAAGQMLGLSVGEFFLNAANITVSPCRSRTFTPNGKGNDDANDYLGDGPETPHGGIVSTTPTFTLSASPLVSKMTTLARAEWNL